MLEYVYKLNLPRWETVKLTNLDLPSKFGKSVWLMDIKPDQYLKKTYHTIKGVHFNAGIVFKKQKGHPGQVHIDNPTWEDPTLMWGINWISGAGGGMEYWERSSISGVRTVVAENGYARPLLETSKAADRTYPTVDGGAYLVNASVPHSAFNDEANIYRYAICVRPTYKKYPQKWETIVDMFSNLIVE